MTPEPKTPLGLYIHWPFCVSKCPYCDFNSHTFDQVEQEAWKAAYLSELGRYHELTKEREISTIFFGGGTPSLMPPRTVEAIMSKVADLWPLAEDLEVTLEANPTTAEAQRFADFARAGINRLSIGVQSFDEKALGFLGRAHGVKEAEKTIDLAAQIFPRYSFDLIYGLPDQEMDDWRTQLDHALRFKPEHLSAYQLTIEKGTAFYKDRVPALDGDKGADFYELTNQVLEEAGLPAYEVSNHAKPGQECRHNLIYWRGQDYIGLGPGAHGRISTPNGVLATQEIPTPQGWIGNIRKGRSPSLMVRPMEPADRQVELLIMGLRLKEGIDLERFERLGGAPFLDCLSQTELTELCDIGLMVADDRSIRASGEGMLLLNHLIERLWSE